MLCVFLFILLFYSVPCLEHHRIRALVKREYLVIIRDNFCYFCIKTYVVTPHLKRLDETVQMRGHNIWFCREIRKIIIKYSLLSRALIE